MSFIDRIFVEVKPEIVIHTAAPRPNDENATESTFIDTNITGTRNLIEAAKKYPSTRGFILSSTVNVISGNEHITVAENDRPYWAPNSKAIPYWRTKAQAEQLVLAANSDQLKIVALRLCLIIGIQEYALVPAQLDALAQKKTGIQLGDNKNLIDTMSAENSANAYLLAMHALLDPSKANGKVDGEAFNITDDNPLPFWDVSRIIWRTGGDTTDIKDVKVIPAWMATAMALLSEVAYGILFYSSKSPEFNRQIVNFCTHTYTYDISKARKVLGYSPVKKTEQGLKEATEREMKRRVKEGSGGTSDGSPNGKAA